MKRYLYYLKRQARYLLGRLQHLLWLRLNSRRRPLGDFASLPYSSYAMHKLCTEYHFKSVLDIGSGQGVHSSFFSRQGKQVTALDLGDSAYFRKRDVDHEVIQSDFLNYTPEETFDCVWASHVLEHAPNPNQFIQKMIECTKPDGIIAITVPPLKPDIVGGHLTLWNAGLLLYNLVYAGLDCRDAAVLRYGYNISIITFNRQRPEIALEHDTGDIERLSEYFPVRAQEAFDGRIFRANW